MKRSCDFYSQIPGFKLVYGGSPKDTFTTYLIGYDYHTTCLNLELNLDTYIGDFNSDFNKRHFGRIIFQTDDVDKLYSYFKSSKEISDAVVFERAQRCTVGRKIFSYKRTRWVSIIICRAFKAKKKNC